MIPIRYHTWKQKLLQCAIPVTVSFASYKTEKERNCLRLTLLCFLVLICPVYIIRHSSFAEVFCFCQYEGLNPGPCACQCNCSTTKIPISFYFLRCGLAELLRLSLDLQSSFLSPPVSEIVSNSEAACHWALVINRWRLACKLPLCFLVLDT